MSKRGPVVILCGGRGTRLQQGTADLPKPLVEIGGLPILWHVVQVYAAQGFGEFILCTGYKGEQIAEWAAATAWPAGVAVDAVDTGVDTQTGGRIKRVEDRVAGRRFWATYGDGVADVPLSDLGRFHAGHGNLATMTVVRPELQFGVTEIAVDGRVSGFREKPRSEHWINGGFFVFEPGVMDLLGEDDVLERAPMERLASSGELHAYRHTGFWDCMDTYKDAITLNDLWAGGHAPWKLWGD